MQVILIQLDIEYGAKATLNNNDHYYQGKKTEALRCFEKAYRVGDDEGMSLLKYSFEIIVPVFYIEMF